MCASQTDHVNGYEAMDHAVDVVERTWTRFMAMCERAWRVFGMEHKLQAAKQYAFDHPVLTLCGLITTCMCSIPIFFFMFFAVGTLFFTFLGFLFVEGFLLTFASVILGGALFVFGLLSVGASSFLALAWCLVSASSGLAQRLMGKLNISEQRQRYMANLFRHETSNGECVKDVGTEKEE